MSHSNTRMCLTRAINLEEQDRIPCCFMSFTALRKRLNEDLYALSLEEKKMGLDPLLFIPGAPRAKRQEHPDLRGLPVRFHPDVRTEHRIQKHPGGTILHKKYITPEGDLTTAVRLSEDWPHGQRIPFIDDYQIPRTVKPLIASREDLELLMKFFLLPPSPEDIADFREEYKIAKDFSIHQDVLLAGGWGVGLDMAFWLCGMQDLMLRMIEDPGFLVDLLKGIHEWNIQRMEVILAGGVDLFIRRAWYEGCDFIMPELYREAILPLLQLETKLAHSMGASFGYICTSGHIPLLDAYLESGIDVLIGLDPVQGTHTDMKILKERIGKKICLWGGVSAAITLERGSEKEIREAVGKAIRILGPEGFVLSPVDNITLDQPQTWKNIEIFIRSWKEQQ